VIEERARVGPKAVHGRDIGFLLCARVGPKAVFGREIGFLLCMADFVVIFAKRNSEFVYMNDFTQLSFSGN
jgi:hypothetical protein